MIARMWQGTVAKEKSARYHEYVKRTGLKDYFNTEGNITAFIFSKDEGPMTRFFVLSLWRDFEAIKEFAGEDYDKARYYPEDEQFLLVLNPYVEHYEVLEPPLS
jgi:heme-degrading monooxygenase HmoA